MFFASDRSSCTAPSGPDSPVRYTTKPRSRSAVARCVCVSLRAFTWRKVSTCARVRGERGWILSVPCARTSLQAARTQFSRAEARPRSRTEKSTLARARALGPFTKEHHAGGRTLTLPALQDTERDRRRCEASRGIALGARAPYFRRQLIGPSATDGLCVRAGTGARVNQARAAGREGPAHRLARRQPRRTCHRRVRGAGSACKIPGVGPG